MVFLNYLIFSLILISSTFNPSQALYEDQIGKFDWKKSQIGKVKFAKFDVADRSVVATEDNVLAVISSKTGEIVWRQVLETDDSRGQVNFLHVQSGESGVITVSGYNPVLFRGWNINSGNLVWEWSLTPIEKIDTQFYFYRDPKIYQILAVWGSHLEVTEYQAHTGIQSSGTTSKIAAGWIRKGRCVGTSSYFACIEKRQLIVIDTLGPASSNLKSLTVDDESENISVVRGQEGYVQVGRQVIDLSSLSVIFKAQDQTSFYMDNSLVQLKTDGKIAVITSEKNEISRFENLPETLDNDLSLMAVKCKSKTRETDQIVCRFLLSTSDGALVMGQQGKIKWIREESLTQIAAVEFLDLTLSDAQGAIEEELNNKDADVISSLYRRLHSQYGIVKNIVLHVLGLGPPPSASERLGLVRDDFGLHKMMVILTNSGKLFGIDNVSGKQIWVTILKGLEGFSNNQNMKLLVQRTSKFHPLPAQCAVIAKDKSNGNGLMYEFNPISGQAIGSITKLSFKIQQVSLLHKAGENYLRSIMLIDSQNNIHVMPKTSADVVDNLYTFIVNKDAGVLTGFKIQYSDEKISAIPIWTVNLGGVDNEQKITNVVSKNAIEKVHSQGRVLSDRSVLYKYLNPNLIAVSTEGPDNIHKNILNIYLIDCVSGSIVFSLNHRRVKGPVNMVHSENWLVYSFYNEKIRRNEITTIELYEGKTQSNSTVWSSLNSPPLPQVERQTYIISGNVAAMRETITEKGITNKHVLIGLHSGQISEMAWVLLDPRRQSMIAPEKQREDGIIPYIPELPIQHETIINYNQTVSKISGIYSAPSGLESTCLVLVYGLDLFVTRVSPSKTFDLLKEDFDYFLISIVLIGLITSSYVVKHLAANKSIKQAWK